MADESLNFKFTLDLSDFDKAPDKIASALASIKSDAEKNGKNVDLAMSGFLQSLIKEREDAIAKLSQELEQATKEVAVAFANMEAGIAGADKEYDKAWESMNKLQKSVAQAKDELNLLNEAEQEVADNASFLNQLKMKAQGMDLYGKAMSMLPAPIANVIQSSKMLNKALMALTTNPIVMTIGALALAIKGLYGWFDGLADRSDGVAYAFGVVTGAVDKAISAINELIHLNVEGFLYNIKTMFDGGEREVAKRNEDLRRTEEQGLRERLARDNQFLRKRMNNTKLDMKDRLDAEKQYTDNLKRIEETRRAELERQMTEWSKKNGLRTKDNPEGWATDISQLSGPLQVELQEMYNEMARIDNAMADITEESKDRLVKMNEEALAEVRKQAEFRRKVRESLQAENRQLEQFGRQRGYTAMQNIINDMADGIEKSSKQAELKMKQSLDSLNDAIYNEAQRLYQRERELYEGDPKNEGKMFKMFELSQYEAQARANIGASEQEKGINATYVRELDKLYENQIKKFQTYENRRIEIERQASETRLAFEKKGLKDSEQAQLAEVDRLKKLFAIDLEEFQSGDFVETALGNISSLSKETLDMLQEELDDFTTQTATKGLLNDDTLKQIDELQVKIAQAKAPYMSLSEAITRVRLAQEALNRAREKGDTKEIVKAEIELGDALEDQEKIRQKLRAEIQKCANEIAELGEKIGGVTGQIMQLLPNIVGVVQGVGNAMKAVTSKTVAELKAIETASIILEIIALVVQLGEAIAQIFQARKEEERKTQEWKDNMVAIYNSVADAVYAYKNALIEAKYAEEGLWAGTNVAAMQKNLELSESTFERYKDLQKRASEQRTLKGVNNYTDLYGQLIANGATASNGKKVKDTGFFDMKTYDMTGSYYDVLETGFRDLEHRGQSLKKIIEDMHLAPLFNEIGEINLKTYNALREQATEAWDGLADVDKKQIEQIAKVAEEYEGYINDLKGEIADWYAPLLDNMTDAWMNWLDTGKDVMDTFKDYSADTFRNILKDILKQKLFEKAFSEFSDNITKATAKYLTDEDDVSYGELIAKNTKKLMDDMDKSSDVYQKAMGAYTEALKKNGIDITGEDASGRNVETRGIARASQESVDENNARLAMMQQHTYSINANVAQLVSFSASALEHLSAIHSNTNRLERIEKSLSNIETYGITTR